MLHDYLQVQDLWTTGIGFDLGGAYLLAKGLIMEPRKLTQVSGSYWNGNAYLAPSVARDRINAISGVGMLGLGFTLQLVGYLLTLAYSPHDGHGAREALVGGAFAAIALTISLAIGLRWERTRLKPTLIEMAHYLGDGLRLDHPLADRLFTWGNMGLGIARHDGETKLAFLRRTFEVTDAVIPAEGGVGHRPLTENDE